MDNENTVLHEGHDEYIASVHKYGKIWGYALFAILTLFPLAVCLIFNATPDMEALGKGLASVLPLFWTVGIVEIFTYVPMLGNGASYLAFVTGNISNLKLPCALDAMEKANVKPTSEEGELISTISIAVSSIVTTFILIIGVVLLAVSEGFQDFLNSEALAPCFKQVLPALFGGLGVVFIAKNKKVALVPMLFMLFIFIVVSPILYPYAKWGLETVSKRQGLVSILVPVGVVISVVMARILYKKGKI